MHVLMQKPPAGKLEIMAVDTDKILAQKATETDKIFRRSEPDDDSSSGKFDDAEEEDQSSHQTYDCVLEYPVPFWIQVRVSAASASTDRSRNSPRQYYQHAHAHAHVHARATDRPENFFASTPEYDGPSSEEQTQLLQESVQRYKASKLSSKQPSSTTMDSEASPGERSPPKSVPAFSSEPYVSGNEYQELIPRCQITDSDIVLGRGGMTNDHPGNIRYRRLVQDNRSFYQRLRKHFKLDHSRKITEALIDGGARFLRRVPIEMGKDHYEIVSFEEARAKVSQALREKPKVQHSKQLRKAYFPGVPSL